MKQQYKWWTYINHMNHLKELKLSNNYEYIFIGDSITEYWLTAGNYYWDKIKTFCFNAGVGGDKINNLFYRLNPNNAYNMKLFDHINFNKIILMIGTNNIYTDDSESIVEQYNDLVKYLLTFNKKLIIFAIIPMTNNDLNNKIEYINKKIKLICHDNNIEYHNINDKLTINVYCDKEHLNSDGYKIWFGYLMEHIFID